jgi:hypothetical protein
VTGGKNATSASSRRRDIAARHRLVDRRTHVPCRREGSGPGLATRNEPCTQCVDRIDAGRQLALLACPADALAQRCKVENGHLHRDPRLM